MDTDLVLIKVEVVGTNASSRENDEQVCFEEDCGCKEEN
jgi:hypothetical protein